jgi:hypothetical protein
MEPALANTGRTIDCKSLDTRQDHVVTATTSMKDMATPNVEGAVAIDET